MEQSQVRKVGEYIIRNCSKEDIPHVISINLQTLPEHYSNFFFEELLEESPETFFVAEKNGKIVGYIMCRIEYGFSNIRRFSLVRKGHIVSIAVLSEDRGKGLGKALIEEAIKGMKKRGCSEAYLEVRVSNLPAIKLYENLGFKTITRLEYYYKDGENAWLMAKSLNEE